MGKAGIAVSKFAENLRKQYSEGMLEYITNPNLSDDLLADAAEIASRRGKIPVADLDRLGGITAKALSRSIAAGQNEEDQ